MPSRRGVPRDRFWAIDMPATTDDVRELLADHGYDPALALRRAARGVAYDGPGTLWTPPPLPLSERIDRPPVPLRTPVRDVRGVIETARLATPRTIVIRETPGPPGPFGAPYWTPERLDNLRARLRMNGLVEVRPNVFQWSAPRQEEHANRNDHDA